jgi:hypothetical protein
LPDSSARATSPVRSGFRVVRNSRAVSHRLRIVPRNEGRFVSSPATRGGLIDGGVRAPQWFDRGLPRVRHELSDPPEVFTALD